MHMNTFRLKDDFRIRSRISLFTIRILYDYRIISSPLTECHLKSDSTRVSCKVSLKISLGQVGWQKISKNFFWCPNLHPFDGSSSKHQLGESSEAETIFVDWSTILRTLETERQKLFGKAVVNIFSYSVCSENRDSFTLHTHSLTHRIWIQCTHLKDKIHNTTIYVNYTTTHSKDKYTQYCIMHCNTAVILYSSIGKFFLQHYQCF